jgi:hypothetical protein
MPEVLVEMKEKTSKTPNVENGNHRPGKGDFE